MKIETKLQYTFLMSKFDGFWQMTQRLRNCRKISDIKSRCVSYFSTVSYCFMQGCFVSMAFCVCHILFISFLLLHIGFIYIACGIHALCYLVQVIFALTVCHFLSPSEQGFWNDFTKSTILPWRMFVQKMSEKNRNPGRVFRGFWTQRELGGNFLYALIL